LVRCIAVILFVAHFKPRPIHHQCCRGGRCAGWQKMEIEGRAVWVNPTPALTSATFRAFSRHGYKLRNFVKSPFHDAGARKMRELTHSPDEQTYCMELDGKLISAPKVRSVIGNDGIITGKPPSGFNERRSSAKFLPA